eukprot:g1271.t1
MATAAAHPLAKELDSDAAGNVRQTLEDGQQLQLKDGRIVEVKDGVQRHHFENDIVVEVKQDGSRVQT